MSREKQDDWKRTQIRIPLPFYEEIADFAEKNNISINTAMLELMSRGIDSKSNSVISNQEQLKAILDDMITPQHKELLAKIDEIQKLLPNTKVF